MVVTIIIITAVGQARILHWNMRNFGSSFGYDIGDMGYT
jgi:hypothetical protein